MSSPSLGAWFGFGYVRIIAVLGTPPSNWARTGCLRDRMYLGGWDPHPLTERVLVGASGVIPFIEPAAIFRFRWRRVE